MQKMKLVIFISTLCISVGCNSSHNISKVDDKILEKSPKNKTDEVPKMKSLSNTDSNIDSNADSNTDSKGLELPVSEQIRSKDEVETANKTDWGD